MARLPHAMGDVHPHALKAELAQKLSRITFERWANSPELKTKNPKFKTGKVIFANSGFEAVEAALKTAMLATGRHGVIAFAGAYHGLGYGALNATHRDFFRKPFRPQMREFVRFVPFPSGTADMATVDFQIRHLIRREWIGAILVEPVQARGGINVPPPEFLPLLRKLCDEFGALLIADEIYTGFGRTGKWFACEHSGGTGISPVSRGSSSHGRDARATIPDLICLGKALTGGFPLSACVGRANLMDAAWPASRGEALHTSTFLGNPVGCAMALAQIKEIERLKLPERSAQLGGFLLAELQSKIPNGKFQIAARGLGLMAGMELRRHDGSPATAETFAAIKTLLQRGFIFLPEGEYGNVISFMPPLTITKPQLAKAVAALKEVLATD
jgi:4-aminobutyrate aminotransferase-like enzyme